MILAVTKGHTGVVDLLVHKYNCSLTEVDRVSVFDVLGCQSSIGVNCHCFCPAFSECLHVVSICVGMYVYDKTVCPCHQEVNATLCKIV